MPSAGMSVGCRGGHRAAVVREGYARPKEQMPLGKPQQAANNLTFFPLEHAKERSYFKQNGGESPKKPPKRKSPKGFRLSSSCGLSEPHDYDYRREGWIFPIATIRFYQVCAGDSHDFTLGSN